MNLVWCPPTSSQVHSLYLLLFTIAIYFQTGCLAEVGSNHLEKQHYNTQRRSIDEEHGSFGDSTAAAAISAGGYLLAQSTDQKLNLNDPIDRNLSLILDRDGPDMRPSRNCRDFTDITANISIRAWDLMHEHAAIAIEQKIDAAWPLVEKLLADARVSKQCVGSIKLMMAGAKRMESWAVKMVNAWGNFPFNGLFEGTYGDLGSFDSCIDIRDNKYIDHAHYCSVSFRPLMPSTKDYELIVRKEPDVLRYHFESQQHKREHQSLIRDFHEIRSTNGSQERDAFTDILNNAQYHHFVYYKWGTCWPIQCSPFDVRRVAKLVGRRNILTTGPVKCYSKNESDYEQPDELEGLLSASGPGGTTAGNTTTARKKLAISTWDNNNGIFIWKPHLTKAHKVAFTIIGVVTAVILFVTLIDICINRVPSLYRLVIFSAKGLPLDFINNGQKQRQLAPRAITSSFAICGDSADQPQEPLPLSSGRQMHPTKLGFSMVPSEPSAANAFEQAEPTDWMMAEEREPSLFMSLVDDFSIVTNMAQFFRVSENQMRTDILCLNGIRCITMVWIIMTHTMMYNDWAQFARTKSIEVALNSLLSQPLFNGSYLVDTFFLMSGLLSAFTAFKHCKGISAKFNSFAYIFGRWLRLTPQIFFISMIFIIVPTLSYGPHWYPMVGEYSENCVKNWWINVLHLQAFYKKEEMCNFVTWWISIDFFYHFFALAVIWVIMLAGHKLGFLSIAGLIIGSVGYQSYRHYTLGLPPNVFSTIPQTGAMWTTMTLDFFWTPYTHSIPFFFGFYIGYLMALKKKLIMKWLNTRRALIGWIVSVFLLVGQSFSTYWWVTGKASYSRLVSTIFFGFCSFIWAGSICWIIIACQHGYGGFVNRVLSWKVFIVLGKASYLVYLSHFQILFLYYGNQGVFLEPSNINMLYIVIGNITLSTIYGIFLCAVYELPWLKVHRRLMKYV